MRTNRLSTVYLALAALSFTVAACAPQQGGSQTDGSGGSSGNQGSGGSSASGGTKGSGGNTGTGGVSGSGGKVGSGGSSGDTGSGGSAASGGATGSGGTAAGGAASTGGATGRAGMSGTATGGSHSGGATATGSGGTIGGAGRSGSGGATTAGSGGAASGGATGSGGVRGSGGTTGSGGSTNSSVMHPPPITNGQSGWASRYWDCCKPACGWKGNVSRGNPMMSCDKSDNSLGGNYDAVNACQGGGTAYMCWSGIPWSADDTLAYAFAAASGSNYSCGRCYQLQFTGTNNTSGDKKGTPALSGKTMIVQVINNGGVQATQFDLLIPGGGVGALNACATQWGMSDLGSQYGGFLTACNGDKNCTMQKCQTVFGDKPDLMEGCMWFLGWFGGSNNPDFTYQKVACPQALTAKSGLSDPG